MSTGIEKVGQSTQGAWFRSTNGPLGHDALTPAKETKSFTSRFNRSTGFPSCCTTVPMCIGLVQTDHTERKVYRYEINLLFTAIVRVTFLPRAALLQTLQQLQTPQQIPAKLDSKNMNELCCTMDLNQLTRCCHHESGLVHIHGAKELVTWKPSASHTHTR